MGNEVDDEEPIRPEAGDPVSVYVRGTVDSIDGDVAYVRPVFVNDHRVPESPPDKADKEGSDNDESIEAAAMQEDEKKY